ncbi:hypothetical protein [Clostridium sp.]|uniref:hypothetical protein n=1 Tax=Clostridium sp. TaxID=1506 RepID=UPI001A4CA625|nr:hypothetical protein [Clostridium sp.]MBK5241921.1 hypothetical protein [Clostridium sp.]
MSRKEEGFSLPEKTLTYYMLMLFPEAIESYQSIFLGAKEIDVFIPSLNLGIEYDGGYWHKNKLDDDIAKNSLCEDENIELIRIREYGLPDISHICKCFYLTNKGSNLSDVIKELVGYICSKYKVENGISINISRDSKEIMLWYENAKERTINKRWNEIVNYYSDSSFIKPHPLKAFIYYTISDGNNIFVFWFYKNIVYTEITDIKNTFRCETADCIIEKVNESFKHIISYFKVGLFCFENEVSRTRGLNVLEKIYLHSTLGRYSLKFPKKVEYIYDNPLWNMMIEQVNSRNDLYMNEDVEMKAQLSFCYGNSIYGMAYDYEKKKNIVSDCKKYFLITDIFDEELNYKERAYYIVSQSSFYMNYISRYLYCFVTRKNILFKDEYVKEAFFKFMQPFYIIKEDGIWQNRELLKEALEYSLETLEAIYIKKYIRNIPRKDRNIYYEKLALSDEISEQTKWIMLNDTSIKRDIKKMINTKNT